MMNCPKVGDAMSVCALQSVSPEWLGLQPVNKLPSDKKKAFVGI